MNFFVVLKIFPEIIRCYFYESFINLNIFWETPFISDPVYTDTLITDAHSCQRLLQAIGFVYNANYFVYDYDEFICKFYVYAPNKFDCESYCGVDIPDIANCKF